MTLPVTRSTIAFIGLGNMGGPMARNLVAAGFDVVATDLDPTKVEAVVSTGARAAVDAADAVAVADVVMTSLPGPDHVRAVAEQIVPKMRAGATWIDLSTNDLACARDIAAMAADHGLAMLDAPVTGGSEGATAGTLTVLVGGDVDVVERCRPLLAAIGSRIEHLGPHGTGYVAKIAQVMLCYLHSVCLTEALALGVKGGVRADRMLDVIRNSTGRSYVADRYGPELLNGGYDDTFDLGLAAKDLRLALELADHVGATLPFTADVGRLYDAAVDEFGFDAPHLRAMHRIERANDLILHRHGSRQRSTT